MTVLRRDARGGARTAGATVFMVMAACILPGVLSGVKIRVACGVMDRAKERARV